jgi:hypothetical protein
VKIPNSSIVNVEGEEQVVSFFVRVGKAEETAESNRTRKAVSNMIALTEERLDWWVLNGSWRKLSD